MSAKSTRVTISTTSLLTILFVGLKLTGQIDWSWWWVVSPLWIEVAVLVGFSALIFVIAWAAGK
ncbi:MAG: hypothetical protein AAFR07_05510 [Pseudomonadota bacterium]